MCIRDSHSFVAACYNPRDGVVFPWPFLWGYANAASELGVSIHTYTKVTGIDVLGPVSYTHLDVYKRQSMRRCRWLVRV